MENQNFDNPADLETDAELISGNKETGRENMVYVSAVISNLIDLKRSVNQDDTVYTLNEYDNFIKEILKNYSCEIISLSNGSAILSFNIAEQAVNFAKTLIENTTKLNGEKNKLKGEIKLQIGINAADSESGKTAIDFLDIAVRLQARAYPGTIFISGSVYDKISEKREFAEEQVEDIEGKAYRFVLAGSEAALAVKFVIDPVRGVSLDHLKEGDKVFVYVTDTAISSKIYIEKIKAEVNGKRVNITGEIVSNKVNSIGVHEITLKLAERILGKAKVSTNQKVKALPETLKRIQEKQAAKNKPPEGFLSKIVFYIKQIVK